STSGIPFLAKIPFSFATNNGAASVSAIKPRVAFVTSGPSANAIGRPKGNCVLTAPSNAAVPAPALRSERRLKPRLPLRPCLIVIVVAILRFVLPRSIRPTPPFPLRFLFVAPTKKPPPEARQCAFFRTAALLSARHWTRSAAEAASLRSIQFKCCAKSAKRPETSIQSTICRQRRAWWKSQNQRFDAYGQRRLRNICAAQNQRTTDRCGRCARFAHDAK